jgi:hypothetical protein
MSCNAKGPLLKERHKVCAMHKVWNKGKGRKGGRRKKGEGGWLTWSNRLGFSA